MSNENYFKVDVYHQNLPGFSILLIALTYFWCNVSSCDRRNGKETRAEAVCEAQAGKEDPRCVGYFGR